MHVAKIIESATDHKYIFTCIIGAFSHFFQAKINQFQLQIIVVEAFVFQFENPHFLELETHTAAGAHCTISLVKMGLDVGNGPYMVVCRSFHQNGHTMRSISFVKDLLKVFHVFSLRSFDGSFNPVFRHVDALRILKTTAQEWVGIGVRSTCFYRNGNFFADPGELFGHPVPAGKHRRFPDFKYPSHGVELLLW